MINWKELFELERTVFHCETEDSAIELLNIAHNHGYKWCDNVYFSEFNNWENCESETCYNFSYSHNESSFARKSYYQEILRYNIINVRKLLLSGRKPFKLNR